LPDEETFLGFLVCSILELDARELYPDIEAAFREDRVDTKVVDLKSVQTDWRIQGTLPPKRKGNGFNLLLRCVECGREREHFVERVMRDTGTIARKAAGEPVKYDSFIMDREIICPKCGSRDRYEMTPLAMLSLVTPASRMNMFSMGEMPGSEFDPRVISFCSVVFGAPMHPLDGLDKYRELIAANPREPINYIRMGNLLRTTFRSSQALEAFRAGYALGVDDPELLTSVALGEHDFGNRVAARSLYERVIALTSTKCHIVPRMNELLCSAKGGLDLLVKGKGSSWDCPGRPDPVKKDTHPPKRKPKKKR
jgi:DNA-directed RNA polymerase subunit RPC12/RpoP